MPESSGPRLLGQLEHERVIGKSQRDALSRIHEVRNCMQHEYPDVRAKAVYQAAVDLLDELARLLPRYAALMRRLG